MLAISIMFTACKKDTSLTEAKKKDPTEQKILNFKEKMLALSGAEGESSNKSNETMSIEDAVWNIEAALNYTYCNWREGEVHFNDYVLDSIVYDNFPNSNIPFSTIISTYDFAVNTMNSSLALLETESKRFSIVDVKYEENNFKILYNINYFNSEKNNKTGGCTELYDDWFWAGSLGKYPDHACSQYAANSIIQYHIQKDLEVYYPGYYTNVHFKSYFECDYPELFGDDLLYLGTISQGYSNWKWLSADEMLEHKNGSLCAFHTILSSKIPSGYKYIGGSADLRGAIENPPNTNYSKLTHYWRIQIGQVHIAADL